MRRLFSVVVIFTLVAPLAAEPLEIGKRSGVRKPLPFQSRGLWVKWKPTITPTAIAQANRQLALSVAKDMPAYGMQVLAVPSSQTAEAAAADLKARFGAAIEFAVPNYVIPPLFTPNDPGFSSEYHLTKAAFPTAWDTARGTGIKIAVADTGFYASHPDLSGNILTSSGYNEVLANTNTTDACGHGTAVAGTAAAVGNNGIGVIGGAFASKIVPIKIVDDVTCTATLSDIDSAIRYAANQGAKVINVSFGSDSICDEDYLTDAAQYMESHGGVVVKAGGNASKNRGCSDHSEIVEVSATDSNDALASFSNFGNDIDIAAPGVGIVTTNCNSCTEGSGLGDYVSADGTSFAAPVTAAVLALIFQANPSISAAGAKQVLFDSADDLGTPGRDIYFGYGRVNAARAVSTAASRGSTSQTNSLASAYAYPNPWDVRKGHDKVHFNNLPDGTTVKIFTLAGFFVTSLTSSNNQATWSLTNDNGQAVASGLYLYLLKSSAGDTATGKIAVIR